MGVSFKHCDCYRSFQTVQKNIELAVKNGTLTEKEARETLEGARAAYRRQDYNRMVDKANARNIKSH